MAWAKGSTNTLTGTGDALIVSEFEDKTFYNYMYNSIVTGGDMTEYQTAGSGGTKDTGSNYATRTSGNGGADSTYTSRANMVVSAKSGSTVPELGIGYIANISAKEKLHIMFHVSASASGAGTAPERQESVGKHVQTSNPLDVISFDNTGTGDYAVDTNLSVLGG
tara:strand:+ start:228 stop:722 length:495 start_codon:yes stop_codon:yes gene_type:complete